jgi:hypothetical protein
MIHLNVTLNPTLVDRLREDGWKGVGEAWEDFCTRHSLTDLRTVAEFFESDREPSPDELSLLDETISYIDSNLRQSIQHINKWLPDVADDVTQDLMVMFLPYGKYTFGPEPGLQLFSVDSKASPLEAYLFLVHVYYHELSSLNETPKGRRCSSEQVSAEDFKEWVRLLIRNEGIGNYAILEELLKLRDTHADYLFRYFTYAKKIGDPALLQSAVSILSNAFSEVDDENVAHFRNGINKIFKNEALPIINLVGTHMAESIANHYDISTLKNVHQREAAEFFALYGETGAPFAENLKDL